MILTLVAVGVAGVVVGAIVKHGSVAAAEASAKKEIADIKAEFAKIEAAVREFWLMVQNKTPPPPNFEEDHEVVSQLHNRAGGGWTNLTGNARAEDLCKQLMDASKIAADSDKTRKACRAELLTMLGNADTATCGDYKITSGMVAESHVDYTKASYRNVRVTKKGAKK